MRDDEAHDQAPDGVEVPLVLGHVGGYDGVVDGEVVECAEVGCQASKGRTRRIWVGTPHQVQGEAESGFIHREVDRPSDRRVVRQILEPHFGWI